MSVFPFAESFERYKVASTGDPDLFANLTSRYTNVTGNGLTILTTGRTGQCMQFGTGALSKTLPHSGRIVTGFAVMFTGTASGENRFYQLANCDVPLFTLLHDEDGTLSMRAGTNIAQSMGVTERALFLDTWYYVEVDVAFSGTSPIVCTAELRINGQVVIASNAVNTVVNTTGVISGTATGNFHTWANGTGGLGSGMNIDDVYIKNTAGYYGDIRIVALFPNGDGATLQWTPSTGSTHYLMVNSHPVVLTTYLKDLTPGDIDTWDWEDCPGFSGTIKAINISMDARKDDEGTKSFKIVVGNAGTEALSDEFFVSDLTPEYYEFGLETDPATGLAWTQVGFNAKQFGVKLIS